MPTYEYECKTCGHNFEVFQNMSDPALTSCPECGNEVRRLINGGTGIIFKGSGFYVTDKGSSKSSSSSSSASCSACSASDSGTCASKTAV
ncbi:FmdB family zinc ribbon protein [Gracilinema caldarium]|uniref:Regulatory protein, FmdB family n=1 Tax=Gracilinema caldarium (strain ATCC 51460 / DSM 7334 / H1) TaxID=744872 RepID=F8F0I5_GRAC1|nr:FmdB family zinc ribbon protein [Gracilinema caldarium]AEJ19329.1 regulatory protein, FmdB family [Gracilinema caldarium DSM 7334]